MLHICDRETAYFTIAVLNNYIKTNTRKYINECFFTGSDFRLDKSINLLYKNDVSGTVTASGTSGVEIISLFY